MGMLDSGDAVDDIVKQVGKELWQDGRKLVPEIVKEIAKESGKHGIDPNYISWILVNRLRDWKPEVGSDFQAVQVLVRLLADTPRARPGSGDFTLPDWDGEKQVDSALKAIGKWATKTLIPMLFKALTRLVRKYGDQVKSWYDTTHDQDVPLADARYLIVRELPLRVRDHPFWFDSPHALRAALTLMLD